MYPSLILQTDKLLLKCLQTMLKALPVFLNCFYRLVSSVMYEGRQKGETDKGRHAYILVFFKAISERF